MPPVGERTNDVESWPPPFRLATAIRNVMANWAGYLFGAIVSFFLAPFVLQHLGVSRYAVWSLIVSITGYLGLLDLGVRSAVTRYVARYHVRSEHSDASRIVSSAALFFTLAAGAAIVISVLISTFLIESFRLPQEYQASARIVIVLIGSSVAASLIGGVFGGVLVGLQRFDIVNTLQALNTALRAILIVGVLRSGGGLISLAVIQFTLSVLDAVLCHWFSRRLYPELKIQWSRCAKSDLSQIFRYSSFVFAAHVSRQVTYYTDVVVIGVFLPLSSITFFAIAGNLADYTRTFIGGIRTTLAPLASAFEATERVEELQNVLLHSARYCTMFALPICITLLLRGHTFIGLWMGSDYAGLSGTVLIVLMIAMSFGAATGAVTALTLGTRKYRVVAPVTVAEALYNLLVSIILVRSMGVVGVALGTTVPSLAVSCLFWPWYLRRSFAIPVRRYVIGTWIRPIGSVLPFALITYAIDSSWQPAGLLTFFLQTAACLPVAIAGLWVICLTRSERQLLSRTFRS